VGVVLGPSVEMWGYGKADVIVVIDVNDRAPIGFELLTFSW